MFRFVAPAALTLLMATSALVPTASWAQDRTGRTGGRDGSGGPPAAGQTPPAGQAPAQTPAAQPAPAAAPAPAKRTDSAGSYTQTCKDTAVGGDRLFSHCRTNTGAYRLSSIEFGRCVGDIGNANGLLTCNGAAAQDGGIVEAAPSATASSNRDPRGRNAGQGQSQNQGSGAYTPGSTGGRGGYGASTYGSQPYGAPAYGTQGYGDDRGYQGAPSPRGYQGNGYPNGGYQGGGYPNGAYQSGGYPNGGGYQGGGYAPPPSPYGDRYGQNDRDRGGYGYGARQPSLVLYEGVNFTGRAFEIDGDVGDLSDRRFNDRAKSVKVYSGRWKLCRESDFRRCEHVTRDIPDLRALNASDQISSVQRE